ncbi:MAG: saccharopine dehydrogenase NADP-binding domain-containing protein [Rhodospirillales bacterium]|nr:saccharopine dehydrogenase NADP-binding domain-containing protein [Rhodospirillales bacterium]
MRVIIFGAGAIGAAIAEMLAAAGGYRVTVVDRDSAALARLRPRGLELRQVDVADRASLLDAARGHDAVVSALPFFLNRAVAEAALKAKAHYLDLTEDVATTRAVRRLADGASRAFIPQCGLAPGFVGIAAHALAQRFDRLRDVRMRVGALPRNPTNALKYNLTWSTDGLINEYCNPCEAIRHGRLVELAPLEGLERFSLDGVEYEAFNTSGGLGTLCETLAGKVETLDYKTVRYPGHRDIMKVLLDDLRLSERRQLLKEVLESAVPSTRQDVVLVFVAVSGWREGRLVEESFVRKIYGGEAREAFSAIQAATAAGLCAMLELLAAGKIPQQGFVRQEEARLEDVLATRFGAAFADGEVRSRPRMAA